MPDNAQLVYAANYCIVNNRSYTLPRQPRRCPHL